MTEKERYNNLYKSLLIDNKLIHVGLLLKRAAQKWPDNTTVICDDISITYQELYNQANLLAQKLQEHKVTKDDKIIILWDNSIDFYISYFGVWQSGAIIAPLNVFLTENEALKIIDSAKPKVLIISEKFLEKFPALSNLEIPIISKIYNKNNKNNKNINFEIPDRDINETAAILYTSGTTGFPKGVMLTSKNIIINTIQGVSRFESSDKDRIFCALPLFHTFPQNTCVWTNVVIGSTAIITSKIERHSLISGLKHKPTVIIAVPALYGLFCKMKNIDFGPIRYFISGGDALSDKIRAGFELLYRRKLCNGYGLTETSPFLSVDIDDYTQPTSTIGRPFLGIECQIRDNLNILDKNQVGVLWVKGDNVMKGYYNAPELTDEVIKDGWFNTGDLAYITTDNKIILAGREKDLIKSKGINIYPQEIENLLLTNNKVIQAAVVAETDHKDQDEEYPIAYISSTEQDQESLKKELLNLCKQNLASYKIPRRFIIKKLLPVTATGKIDKKNLKPD